MVELAVEVHEELTLLLLSELWVQEFSLEQLDVEGWLDVVLVFHWRSINLIGTKLTACNSSVFWSGRTSTELRAMLAPTARP